MTQGFRYLAPTLTTALRKNATSVLGPSVQYVTLPEDFLAPWELAAIVNGSYSYLLLKDVSFLREAYPNPSTTAVPKYYAVFDENTLQIAPTPSVQGLVELHYFYYPETIVTAGTTWVGNNFENVLLYGALVEAAVFMKSEEDTMKAYSEQYAVNLKLLRDYAEGKLKSGNYRN